MSKSLRQKAYNWLKNKIITLEFAPSEPLSEIDLSKELGIGRTPVREALQQLMMENLVVILPRKGTFVSNINFGDFEHLLDARRMLELHVVSKLAENPAMVPPDQFQAFKDMFEPIPELAKARDINKLLSIDRNFHQGLVEILRNPYLNNTAQRTYDLVSRAWYLSFKNRTSAGLIHTTRDHISIIEAIEARDVKEATQLIKNHINSFRNSIFSQY